MEPLAVICKHATASPGDFSVGKSPHFVAPCCPALGLSRANTLLACHASVPTQFGGLAFLEPVLGPQLERELGITPAGVGLMFALACFAYVQVWFCSDRGPVNAAW